MAVRERGFQEIDISICSAILGKYRVRLDLRLIISSYLHYS